MKLSIGTDIQGLPTTQKFLEIFNKRLEQAEQVVKETAIEVGERVIDRTPVDTGRAKGNWQTTLNTIPNQGLMRYDKNGVEAKEELHKTVEDFNLGDTINISNQVTYSVPLEFGSSKQAPAGMVRVTVSEFKDIVDEVVERVNSSD